MSWNDRINLCLEELGCSKRALAERLSVSPTSIKRWCRGENAPAEPLKQALERIGIAKDTSSYEEGCYAALMTPAVDPSSDIILYALNSRDVTLLSSIAHCVASKMASTLLNVARRSLVMSMRSVFNCFPVKETIIIEAVGHPDVRYEVLITHPAAGAVTFTLICTAYLNDKQMDQYATWATDKGLVSAAKRITSQITLLCRKQDHHTI